VEVVKITIHDLLLLIIGFWFGINKIFINTTGGYLIKVIAVLALSLSILLLISCVSNLKTRILITFRAIEGKLKLFKEFRVCYTLDGDVKWGNIRQKSSIKKDDVLQEILKKIERCDFFIVKSDNNYVIINTSKVRYIRIFDEKDKFRNS
jgi:hypothetical protein